MVNLYMYLVFQQSFKDAKVVSRNGASIVDSMAKEIEMMMDLKVSVESLKLFVRIEYDKKNLSIISQNL